MNESLIFFQIIMRKELKTKNKITDYCFKFHWREEIFKLKFQN